MSSFSVNDSAYIRSLAGTLNSPESKNKLFVLDVFVNKYYNLIIDYNSFFQYYNTDRIKYNEKINILYNSINNKYKSFKNFNCNGFTNKTYNSACNSIFSNPIFIELKNVVDEYNVLTNLLFNKQNQGQLGGYRKRSRRLARKTKRVRKTKGSKKISGRRTRGRK
jgi:hypothetical protein